MLSIKDILLILRNRLKTIILITIAFAIVAILYTYMFIDPIFTSKSSLYVLNENSRGSGSISTSQISASQSLVNTYIMIIKSETTLTQVSADLEKQGYNITAKELQEILMVNPITNTEAFYIMAKYPSSEMAQAITSSVVKIGPTEIIRIVGAGSVKIIDYPSRPEKAEFPVLKNVATGIIAGLFTSVTIVLLLAIFDTKVHDESILKQVFDLPIIGVIPQYGSENDPQSNDSENHPPYPNPGNRKKKNRKRAKRAKDLISRHNMVLNPDTPFSVIEAYKEIRTNLLYLPIKSQCKKIAITSSHAREGKTVTSINLAIVMAQIGKRVLLVDADMRASLMASYLGIESSSGLSEYLVGIDETPNIIHGSGKMQGISILLKGNTPPNPAELLLSERMNPLFQMIERDYDYVFFDTPPVNVVTDATALLEWVNGYLMVVRAEYSDIEAIKTTIEKISNLGATIYGFILGEYTFSRSSYGKYHEEKYGLYNKNM